MISAVVGLNWGDEGKGRITDYLARDNKCVVRFQGGDNAGHTIINNYGEFKLHHIPAGIFYQNKINIIAAGSVLNPESFFNELVTLKKSPLPESELIISDRAVLTFPYHIEREIAEEKRMGQKKYDSTLSGIAPSYSDRYAKKSLQAGELCYQTHWQNRLKNLVKYQNEIFFKNYRQNCIDYNEVISWLEKYKKPLIPYIQNTLPIVKKLLQSNEKILVEAQLGALRDVNHGIYPYTTSSPTLAAYACASLPAPPHQLKKIIGVTKAYATCVGAGPFVTEMNSIQANSLRNKAGEYGAKTNRPRRIGYFDAVATSYGVSLQQANQLAITCLDILSGYKTLKICTHYLTDSNKTQEFPLNPGLEKVKPFYIEQEGWNQDISQVTDFHELPKQAKKYIKTIQDLVKIPIKYISTGPERNAIIEIKNNL